MNSKRSQILNLLDSMHKAFEYYNLKARNGEYDSELNNILNTFIDGFLSINKNVGIAYSCDIQQISNKLADSLVETVELINSGKFENLSSLLDTKIKYEFDIWKENIENYLKYKIIVYGINNNFILLPQIIDPLKANIIAYIDNNESNIGKYINGVKIINIHEVCQYEYDYLLLLGGDTELLTSSINKGDIPESKIFNFNRHYLIDADYNFYAKYYGFIDSDKRFEGFITGLSYVEVGINASLLKKRFFNFGVSSQDLFFDYHLMRFALNFEELKNTIKYAIIGIPYYGFQYDLSKSKNRRTIRTEIYYPVLGTVHNYQNGEAFIKQYELYKNICDKILKPDYSRIIFDCLKDSGFKSISDNGKGRFSTRNLSESEKEVLIEKVRKDFNKKYSLTVKENKEILIDYLLLLSSHNIKPIMVVCPVTKLYSNNCSAKIRDEFNSIICELRRDFKFQYIDLFQSEDFQEEDFYDTSHLNYIGAEKFTNMLNNIIEW